MKEKFKQIWGKADDIILRYPLVLTMALIAAISSVVAIELDTQQNQFTVIKLVMTACLGISLMFAVKMLSQRIGKEYLMQILALGILAVFFYVLPNSQRNFTEAYAFVLIPSYILSHLLVSFLSFFGEKRELNFWQYNKNLFINIFLTAVFTGVLVGGVMLAILAVDNLFDLNFNEDLYPKTFLFLAILGSCFIFLLFNGKGLSQLERDSSYPQILKFFTQFVLIPLLLIYVVILYFYFGKILINWELPRGWVSYLILAYSVVGILALLLVHPLKEDSTKSWVKIFSKVFYYSLIPLLVMLFTAIFTRILEYGYTEARYYVLLLAVWLTAVVLYFIFIKKPTIKFVPVSLFAFGLFALIFPYFNAFSVAKKSQKNELEKILVTNNLLKNGKIDFNKKIKNTVADEVANKMDYLYKRFEEDYIFSLLGSEQVSKLKKTEKTGYRDIHHSILGFFKYKTAEPSAVKRVEIYTLNSLLKIDGYTYMARVQDYGQKEINIGRDKMTVQNNLRDSKPQLLVKLNVDQSVDLLPFIQKKLSEYQPQIERILVDDISTEFTLGKYQVKILFGSLTKEKLKTDQYFFGDAILLIK